MFMYYVVEYVVLALVCWWIVNKYAHQTVSKEVRFWSIFTWVLNFGLVLLVPEDIYLSTLPSPRQPQSHYLAIQYSLLYWTVYLLTWTVIPFLQEWQNAGDLTSEQRMKRSLRVNAYFYLGMLVGGLLFLFLLVYFNLAGNMGLLTYLACLASCWGIVLLMVMMGYAMVEIPRSLWLSSQPDKFLHYCYQKVEEVQDEILDAEYEFKKIVSFVLHTQQNCPNEEEIKSYCQAAMKCIPGDFEEKIPKRYEQFLTETNYLNKYQIGLESSIEHHRLMKRIIGRYRRLQMTVKEYLEKAILLEDILDAKRENKKLVTPLFEVSALKNFWYLELQPIVYRVLSILFGIGSLIVLISETQVFLTPNSSLLGYLLNVESLQLLRIFTLLTITFIAYMVYYSLFRIKLAYTYGLYQKCSDGPSLMFATINFSRVGVAIVFNFLDMIKVKSIYEKVMGIPEMGELGGWVLQGMPGILWIIFLTHYFDLWSKLIRKLKLSDKFTFGGHVVAGVYSTEAVRRYRGKLEEQKEYFGT